jgi:hypothetical protein
LITNWTRRRSEGGHTNETMQRVSLVSGVRSDGSVKSGARSHSGLNPLYPGSWWVALCSRGELHTVPLECVTKHPHCQQASSLAPLWSLTPNIKLMQFATPGSSKPKPIFHQLEKREGNVGSRTACQTPSGFKVVIICWPSWYRHGNTFALYRGYHTIHIYIKVGANWRIKLVRQRDICPWSLTKCNFTSRGVRGKVSDNSILYSKSIAQG